MRLYFTTENEEIAGFVGLMNAALFICYGIISVVAVALAGRHLFGWW